MPNVKLGTVCKDVAAAVQAAKQGQVEFRAEKAGIVHAALAKCSFPVEHIENNVMLVFSPIYLRVLFLKVHSIQRLRSGYSEGQTIRSERNICS